MIQAETPTELAIVSDPEWIEGVAYGEPRPGHPEGTVERHIVEVLANVDREARDADDRARLRLITLVHDTFKNRVDHRRPKVGMNQHGRIARRFAERYIDDAEVLDVIELHDDAYIAWRDAHRAGRPELVEPQMRALIERLGPALPLYLRFYRADNATGDKTDEHRIVFERLAEGSLYTGGAPSQRPRASERAHQAVIAATSTPRCSGA